MLRSNLTKFLSFGVIQKVRSLRGRREGVIEKQTKMNTVRATGGGGVGGRRGVVAFVYVHFFKKNAEIFNMKFYSYSPVFPIDYNGSMKY